MKNETTEAQAPDQLLCEYQQNALGINTHHPRFTWWVSDCQRGLMQAAYQIIVSSKREKQENGYEELWNTDKVESNCSVNIPYMGKQLESGRTYYWKVRIWNSYGNPGEYSKTESFGMGILEEKEWKAQWIGMNGWKYSNAPLFRKEMDIHKKVAKAKAFISGLGYYEMHINGSKVGDSVLDPGWTDYTKRILYSTYDITSYLVEGRNALGVMIGNGWFDSNAMLDILEKAVSTPPIYLQKIEGRPQLFLQIVIDYEDGSKDMVITDEGQGWLATEGPMVENHLYNGETYDARLEKKGWDMPCYKAGAEWQEAVKVASPGGALVSQVMEPIKVTGDIKPVCVSSPEQGLYIIDLGQNISGWLRMNVQGAAGTKVVLKYAEVLNEDGKVNQENLRSARSTDTYILKGSGSEIYEPKFTYHGFRYVQLEGYPGEPEIDNFTGRHVRTALERTGFFECSNALLNKIYSNIIWTEMDNQHSVPTDCPQRDERLGWLNDMTARAGGVFYSFKIPNFYSKWMDDIQDTQDAGNGAIADTAPFIWGSRPADPVCSCYILIPWLMYVHYSDRKILEKHYSGMKRWVKYLESRAEHYLLDYSYYGDWVPPITESIDGNSPLSANTPGDLTSTAFLYFDALLMWKIATVLGNEEDKSIFEDLASKVKAAFNEKYLDKDNLFYGSGNQACNVLPLAFGMVPEEYKNKIGEHIVQAVVEKPGSSITTGNQSTRYILDVLTNMGRIDTACSIVNSKEYPSWGYMLSKDATTIWERWEYYNTVGMNSHNHPMLGSICHWFYSGLGGLQPDGNCPAFEKVIIKPGLAEDLDYVSCSTKTIRGELSCNWRIEQSNLYVDVTIPFNSSAKVILPQQIRGKEIAAVNEGKTALWERDGKPVSTTSTGIEMCRAEDENFAIYLLQGKYHFVLELE